MALSPTTLETLLRDLATGRWSPLTRQVWEHALRTMPGLWPTPGILESLRHDAWQGRWGPTSQEVLTILLAPVSPTVLVALAQECASGTVGVMSRHILARLG
jgi:hypothetical protein